MEIRPANRLKKALGVSFGIAILIGGTIGVGILRNPGIIAGMLDNYWLIILCWILGGVYVLIGVGSYAELATMLPKAGGSYNYVKRAFGNYAGFLTGWFDYITNCIAPAFFCIVISEYLVILFPNLKDQTTVIAVAFLIGFTMLHATGVKEGSVVQQVTSVFKVVLFVIFILACYLYSGIKIEPIKTTAPVVRAGIAIAFFKSLQLVLGTYDGWTAGSYFAEEDENPGKNIPKSLYTGAIILIIIFVLTNIAFFYVLPVSTLAHSPLAASDVATVVFGKYGATAVTAIALFSLISILNAYMMIPSRILFGLSRDGFFISKATTVNKGGTPIVALLFSSVFSLALIMVGSFEILFSLATFFSIVVWGLAYVSLIKLRISEPNLHRPYRAWGYPFTSILMVLLSLALLLGFAYSDRKSLLTIALVTLFSYPIFLMIKPKLKGKSND
ncbi:MAG: APC family permease [Pedobacter sp.]|nr:APC family permease [Pedobacter sp.]